MRPLTAGSLQGPDAVLTTAFIEQFRDIGWYYMCLGRASTKWAAAAQQFNTLPKSPDSALHWTSLLIAALWRFSKSMWQYRNEVVHGATVEEQAQWQIKSLKERITTLYQSHSENQNMLLPRHQYLFTQRTLAEILQSSYDYMSAWVRSVDEALLVLQHQEATQRDLAQMFFPHNLSESSSDGDSIYTYNTTNTHTSTSLASTATTDISTTNFTTATPTSITTGIYYNSDEEGTYSDDFSLDGTIDMASSTSQEQFDTTSSRTRDIRDTVCSSTVPDISFRGLSSNSSGNSWEVT